MITKTGRFRIRIRCTRETLCLPATTGLLPFVSTCVHPLFLVGFMILILVVFCVMLCFVYLRPVSCVPNVGRVLKIHYFKSTICSRYTIYTNSDNFKTVGQLIKFSMLIQLSEVWKSAWSEYKKVRATASEQTQTNMCFQCIFHCTMWRWTLK